MPKMSHLPLPALVGLETAQHALLLLAVEPRLGGVIFAARAGTGKSCLARGMRALLDGEHSPFVEIPTSIDVDNLLCSVDLPATLQTGKLVLNPGALARAHGGVAHIDGINLLPDAVVNLLLAVLDEGEVRIEREGLSRRLPARFRLVASYDPAEGAPRSHLLDRVGLMVKLPGLPDPAQRAEVVRRNLQGNLETWLDEEEMLRGWVMAAQAQLPTVTISDAQVEQLCATAVLYGVQGHRADLFAVRAACAAAALGLRDEVVDDDLSMALRLVILPRATRIPQPAQADPPPVEEETPPPPEQSDGDEQQAPDSEQDPGLTPPLTQILAALTTELPESLEDLNFSHQRRGRAGSRGSLNGKRGRHLRSLPGDPSRGRIDASATLRAAAPWQPLRAARPTARVREAGSFHFEVDDIRIKQFRSKAGALFCFLVDASGSMALHRMRQAKGAVHTLLQKAYVHRDRVALIAFRGEQAELLMPPTQSVELARHALDLLPTGGGTPLASALLLADDVARQARQRGVQQTVLVLLTDGRANVPARAGVVVRDELTQIGRYLAASPIRIMVVDTQRAYLSRGEAARLAEMLGGEYAYLPGADGARIAELAGNVIEPGAR